jgi:hypothetical protein
MFKHLKLTLSTLLFVALCASHANAGLITFNLAGNSGDGAEGALLDNLATGSVTKGGVMATITAGFASTGGVLNQTASAFGINLLGDGCDVSGQVDNNAACGEGYAEGMVFMFDQLVELVSVTLTSYSPTDDASLTFENLIVAVFFGDPDLPSTPSTLLIGAPVGGPGQRFALVSRAGNGFSIDRFTVRTLERVPEPGILALFALGLLGMARARKLAR